MPDPADTSESVEQPAVKPADDGLVPAPSDGSTGGTTTGNELTAPEGEPPAAPAKGQAAPAGPPTDPGSTSTG